MLGIYLSYGESTTLAPGVWVPSSDVNKRKLQFAVVVGLTALTFTVALQGYFPWDIPFLFRQDFLEVSTKETLAETHGWTRVAIAGDTRFVWCFPFALILSLAVPAVALFLIFLPTLVASADRRQLILSAPNRDRPEWQWYVDRLRSSEHEAKAPLQHTTVREKEHLFLGIDPVAHEEFSLADRSRTDPQWAAFSESKGPDFVSRLNGHINVIGINPSTPEDDLYLVRRALALRFLLAAKQKLRDTELARIDTNMLNAFLHVPEYIHGSRSMRKLVDLCTDRDNRTIAMSEMPPIHQLNMQVDGKAFAALATGQTRPVM